LILRCWRGRIPRSFINKIDTTSRRVREPFITAERVAPPLLLRRSRLKDARRGFIDLALERAFIYRERAPSEVVRLPTRAAARKGARFSMLERLADHDERLMEDLIRDGAAARPRLRDLCRELREGQVVPVLIGAAARGNGVTRLLKALRHEAPRLPETRDRLGVPAEGAPLAQIVKSLHTSHGGKLSVARVLRGLFQEGDTVTGSGGSETRIAGLATIAGSNTTRVSEAREGETLGFARLEMVATGDCFTTGRARPAAIASVAPPEPVFALAVRVRDRKDDVRLTSALAKVVEEDPALVIEHRAETGDMRLLGQGEMHLRVAIERLQSRFQLAVETGKPKIGYRETIKAPAAAHGRHRKQSGGHGQFGDVKIEVRPMPRGQGGRIRGQDHGRGGAAAIHSVGRGRDAGLGETRPARLSGGRPRVTLVDGSYHTVDSSDAAFQAAARLAMGEALPKANPVLLEPILAVEIAVPTEAMARATALVTSRRGQLLGYDSRPGWNGWDVLNAMIPESEIGDLIVELRSATAGVGSFSTRFDHMAELVGRPADHVLTIQKAAAAHS
jgi:elongation factor G